MPCKNSKFMFILLVLKQLLNKFQTNYIYGMEKNGRWILEIFVKKFKLKIKIFKKLLDDYKLWMLKEDYCVK